MSFKPMLSCEVSLDKLNFPMYCSTKLDGIRAVVIDGVVYSRSLKPIRNKYVQHLFGKEEYNGFDGELIVGDVYTKDVFQKTTSGVMSEEGTPDVKFYVFDDFSEPTFTYKERLYNLTDRVIDKDHQRYVVLLPQRHVESAEHVQKYLDRESTKGGEGLILRSIGGKYKYGRSTAKEQYSVKLKFFVDSEFEVVGFTERMHNSNELTYNELGYADRSSAKDGMIPTDTLGSLILKYKETTFNCGVGVGLTEELRKFIWENKEKYLGSLASIRFMSVGMDKLPRIPTLVGFRDLEDISE